jgi:hypothetical protein
MVSIELNANQERILGQLAAEQGESVTEFLSRIVADYLDLESMATDTEEMWAEASIALAPEIMGPEEWDKADDGSK